MKNLTLFLFICICIVGCKDNNEFQISPTVHLDSFKFGKENSRDDILKVFITDINGGNLGTFIFETPSEIQIPNTINDNYEKYHITVVQEKNDRLYLKTFTNLKVNKLIRISDELSILTMNFEFFYSKILIHFDLDFDFSEIDFYFRPNSGNHMPNVSIGSDPTQINNGYQFPESDITYFILKLKEESFFRFKKFPFSEGNEVIINEMQTFSPEVISHPVQNGPAETSIVLNGLDCEMNNLIPLNLTNSSGGIDEFFYIEGNEIGISQYLTSYQIQNHLEDTYYLKYQKGPILKEYQPEPFEVNQINSDFQDLYFIFNNTRGIEITRWDWRANNNKYINWEVIGDYKSKFHAPKITPDLLPEVNTNLAELKSITSIQSTEYQDYEAYVNFIQSLKFPFYRGNFCDSNDGESFELKRLDF